MVGACRYSLPRRGQDVSTYHYRVSFAPLPWLHYCASLLFPRLHSSLALITVIQEMPPKVSAHDHIAGQSTAFNLGCYRLRVHFKFAGSLKKENRKSTENNKKR